MSDTKDLDIAKGPSKSVPLAIWNQVARRQYMSVCLCFPTEKTAEKKAVIASIRAALDRLSAQRPDFAGDLQVDPQSGSISLQLRQDAKIPLAEIDASVKIDIPYGELKAKGFPPGFFVDPSLKKSFVSKEGVVSHGRASFVNVSFIQDGMLLWLHLNHAFADGICLRMFIECLPAQTRGVVMSHPASEVLDSDRILKGLISKATPFEDLLKACPELVVREDRRGPGTTVSVEQALSMKSNSKSEKIFVFKEEKLQELQSLVEAAGAFSKTPSTYQCLAALTWANVVRARTWWKAEKFNFPTEADSKLMMSVNWRNRVFQHETRDFFVNTTTYPIAKVQLHHILHAASNRESLALLVSSIDKCIRSVDEDFVAAQTAAMEACPDIRLLRTNIDLMNPICVGFNTWRHFGADAEWGIPGIASSKPDAVRRVSSGIGVGTALILPAKRDSADYELAVSLTTESMSMLCQSKDWMYWVDHIVE